MSESTEIVLTFVVWAFLMLVAGILLDWGQEKDHSQGIVKFAIRRLAYAVQAVIRTITQKPKAILKWVIREGKR